MKRFKYFYLFALISLVSCQKFSKDTCGTNAGAHTIDHNGTNREYMLYIPSTYDASNPTPVVLNFHGFGGDANSYMEYADLRSLADAENFILVYPQGTCLDGSSHWNPSLPSADNKSTADDLGFIATLITELSANYSINTERIYACGFSNGGMFAYGLAQHQSELIAAVGCVSGALLELDVYPNRPKSIISIHGTSDGVIAYNGNGDYNSIETVLNYWIAFNNTDTTPITDSATDSGTTIEHSLYENGDSLTSVSHYKVIGGGHEWFNLNFDGANTGKLIWDFVSQYDINGLM